jgi:hypothetical protein
MNVAATVRFATMIQALANTRHVDPQAAANGVAGVFMILTAVMVLVPVYLQLRASETRIREVWGHFMLAAGLMVVGVGFWFFTARQQTWIAAGGTLAVFIGLLVQHKDRDSSDVL